MNHSPRRVPQSRVDLLTAKMTPEMCNAIRRQERNASFDYWKSNFNGASTTTPTPERRPAFQNLAHVNIKFPGLFLPTVDNTANQPKRREHHQPMMLRRSNSMVVSLPPKRATASQGNVPRKHVYTDLTCSQLADTLMSYSSGPFPGLSLFRTPANRSRFMDYMYDETEESEQEETLVRDAVTTSGDNLKPSLSKYTTISPENIKEANETDTIQTPTNFVEIEKTSFPKPFKSILKNGKQCKTNVGMTHGEDHTTSPSDGQLPTVCSYQLPNPRNGILPSATYHSTVGSPIQVDATRPRVHSGYVYSGMRRHQQSVRASGRIVPTNFHDGLNGIVGEMATRKRSVRFNAAHQIHEYRPFEPISNY